MQRGRRRSMQQHHPAAAMVVQFSLALLASLLFSISWVANSGLGRLRGAATKRKTRPRRQVAHAQHAQHAQLMRHVTQQNAPGDVVNLSAASPHRDAKLLHPSKLAQGLRITILQLRLRLGVLRWGQAPRAAYAAVPEECHSRAHDAAPAFHVGLQARAAAGHRVRAAEHGVAGAVPLIAKVGGRHVKHAAVWRELHERVLAGEALVHKARGLFGAGAMDAAQRALLCFTDDLALGSAC